MQRSRALRKETKMKDSKKRKTEKNPRTPEEELNCTFCANDPAAFGTNSFVEFAFCQHRRTGIVRIIPWGSWYHLADATPVAFASVVATLMLVVDDHIETRRRQEIPYGVEGMK